MKIDTSQVNLTKNLALLTAQRVLKRKSTWVFLMLGLAPCLIFLFWAATQIFPNLNPPVKPYAMFERIQSMYYVTFYVPILALFMGLGAVADEIETKNITFTLTRPLSRFSIAFGRVFGYLLAGVTLVTTSLIMAYLSNMLFQVENIIERLPNLFNGIVVLSFGVTAYLSVIALFGAVLKRYAIFLGLVWMAIDTVFSLVPRSSMIEFFNIRYRMLSSYWELLPQNLPSIVPVEPGSMVLNAIVCLAFAVIACVLMGFRLSFEIVLSDSAK